MKKLLLFSALLFAAAIHAGIKICDICGKRSSFMPFSAQNKYFCSKKCLAKKISCTNCGIIPKGQYVISMAVDGSTHPFCPRCGNKKRCFSCSLPTGTGKYFGDGRVQCIKCSKQALSHDQARELLQKIRRDLASAYGYDATHPIILRLVGRNALTRVSGDPNSLGCMRVDVSKRVYQRRRRKIENVKWKCTLYLLDNLPPVTAAKVMAHELTHDYIYHHAGKSDNAKLVEGICESISAQWLLSHGYKGYVEAMKKNPDPVYGAGFRMIFPQLERYGIKGLIRKYRSSFTAF